MSFRFSNEQVSIQGEKGDRGEDGATGPPGPQGEPGGNTIGGYDVELTGPAPPNDSILIFKNSSWKDKPKETLVDGGNF